eukprot:TRINITY_DN18717_c0_g1_i1.p1 TRINITY_DN18717_c0_g1~~TRINITY_DN18717_c0_g1_i1.p1  ORF type:complete len:226 (-),score=44.53 TRINITY_DN18717_c0_g1_i1:328-1005(-)
MFQSTRGLADLDNGNSVGLAQVMSFRSVASEFMIKNMFIDQLQKYQESSPEQIQNTQESESEEDSDEFISEMVERIIGNVVSQNLLESNKADDEDASISLPSYSTEETQIQENAPFEMQEVLESFPLGDLDVTEEGFMAEAEQATEVVSKRGLMKVESFALNDISTIIDDSEDETEVKEAKVVTQSKRELKAVDSFALDDIAVFIDDTVDNEESEEDDSSSSSSS